MKPFAPKFEITNAITRDLTVIERARGFFAAATLSETWIAQMSERALLLEAHHTTHIEGTQLTLDQSTTLFKGGEVNEASPDDVRELLNYRDAFALVSEYLESGSPVTGVLVREIHRKLVEGVRGNEGRPGEYRQVQNAVVNNQTGAIIYMPPPSDEVAKLMSQWSTGSIKNRKSIRYWSQQLLNFSWSTFILLLMVTVEHRVCFRRFAFTERGTTSNGCSRSVSFTTVTDERFTMRFKAYEIKGWITPDGWSSLLMGWRHR